MTTTITDAATNIIPDLVLGYNTTRASRNVIHNVIGKAEPDITLELDGLRTGTLQLFFETKETAWEAYNALAGVATWELTDTDYPEIDMNFVREGNMSMELDPVSRRRWIIEVDYQEVF
jgi:hypothetical protein